MTFVQRKPLKSPFPYFGGKSRVAPLIWSRLGDVPNYIEPFAGSLAVLLARPHAPTVETVNDKCGFVSNFWRAVTADPDAVVRYTYWPINECDLHARHSWLVAGGKELVERLEGDPGYYDAKVAGYWVWGSCCWIGGGFCSGKGPWIVSKEGKLEPSGGGQGINRKRPHLNRGHGVNRTAEGGGPTAQSLLNYFQEISRRLFRVRVCCGDWLRVCGLTPTTTISGNIGVLLDPPYAGDLRADGLYSHDGDASLTAQVREWALDRGESPEFKIALCGYEGEHTMPSTWECVSWDTGGGYSARNPINQNRKKERVWFSPHCLRPSASQPSLFEDAAILEEALR